MLSKYKNITKLQRPVGCHETKASLQPVKKRNKIFVSVASISLLITMAKQKFNSTHRQVGSHKLPQG